MPGRARAGISGNAADYLLGIVPAASNNWGDAYEIPAQDVALKRARVGEGDLKLNVCRTRYVY